MIFCTFWRLKFTKFSKFRASKMAYTAVFALLECLNWFHVRSEWQKNPEFSKPCLSFSTFSPQFPYCENAQIDKSSNYHYFFFFFWGNPIFLPKPSFLELYATFLLLQPYLSSFCPSWWMQQLNTTPQPISWQWWNTSEQKIHDEFWYPICFALRTGKFLLLLQSVEIF